MTTVTKDDLPFTSTLAAGKKLTVTTAASSTATLQRLSGGVVVETVSLAASSSKVLGEYLVDQQYKVTGLTGTTTVTESQVADTVHTEEISDRVVNCTASTLAVTEEDHDGKTIVLDRAAGIAVTLPAASAGLKFKFRVKTTFTGAASIKSVAGTDVMIGCALMGNDTDNTVVRWPSVAADTADTIDLLGTSNSTGGMAGQEIEIEGLAANLWYVKIVGDAAGTEATPFTNTVA